MRWALGRWKPSIETRTTSLAPSTVPITSASLVGEDRLAGAVEPVDGHGHALTRPQRDDTVGEVAQDGIPE